MSLWGNSAGAGSTPSSGLFGNSAASSNPVSGGLFGSSNASAPPTTTNQSTGLFGTQQSSQQQQSLLLFGNKRPMPSSGATGGLFGSSNGSSSGFTGLNTGLNTGAGTSSGLFGSNTAPKTGLFGSSGVSNSIGVTGGIGGGSTLSTVNNSNPYQQTLVNVQNEQPLVSMPPSITGQLFQKEEKLSSRRFSYLQIPKNANAESRKTGLLGRLAQAFKHIRNPSVANVRGLFTLTNIGVGARPQQESASGYSSRHAPNKVTKQPRSKLTSLEGRDLANIKRLIIKSKPLKYHQIDANEVFARRRPHITTAKAVAFESNANDNDFNNNNDDNDDDEELDDTDVANIARASKVLYTVSNERVEDESKIRVIQKPASHSKPLPKSDDPELNKGYWCSPPISELVELSEEELLNVKHFIIGREGFGQIAYDHSVDLSRFMEIAREETTTLEKVLFGRFFNFDKKVVLVYPEDEDEKPAVGNGVNVPATITIENVAPKPNQTSSDFIDKLKNMVGAEFVTYDPIAKRWIFKVLHFSVWGLIDEDDLNPQMYEKLVNIKRKQDQAEDQSFIQYQKAYQADIIEQELKKQRLSRDTHGVPGAWGYDATEETPLNVQRNEQIFDEIRNEIEIYKENKISQDLSNVDIQDKAVEYASIESSSSSTAEVSSSSGGNGDPESKVAYLREIFNNLPPGTDLNEIVQERVYEPEITNDEAFELIQGTSNIPTADDWLVQLELTNNLDSPLNPQLLEVGGDKVSQKFNLANVDDILFGDFNKSPVLYSTPNPEGPRRELDAIEATPRTLSVESKLVDAFLNKVHIQKQSNKYPQILVSKKDIKFSDFQNSLQSLCKEYLFLQLASALFDVRIGSEYEMNKTQRESFASWLEQYNKPLLQKSLAEHSNDKLQIVLDYLYYGDLSLAVEAAWETNNAHLSPVLVLLDSNDNAAIAIAQNQLESWRASSKLESIPAPVVKVYQILAREIQTLSAELPWNMVFSLKLLYDDPEKTLTEMIDDTLSEDNDYGNSPVVELLKLYNIWSTKKEEALRFIKESSALSVTLKWVLQEVMLSESDSAITVEFGDYLLEHGLWFESLVVYLCLRDTAAIATNVRRVILQNIVKVDDDDDDNDDDGSMESVLVEKLQIPAELLAEARGVQYEKNGELWECVEEFMRAKLWDEAHRIIAQKLGPSVVICNDESSRRSLLDVLGKFPSHGSVIPTWNTGGGIYENYCVLVANNEDVEARDGLLKSIPFAVGENTARAFNEKVALKLVSRFVGDVAIAHCGDVGGLRGVLEKLYLGESEKQYFDRRLTETNRE